VRFTAYIFFISAFFIAACHKKTKAPEEEVPVPTEDVAIEPGVKCEDLPPAPVPFGWQDSTGDPNKSINAFLFDPLNADKIIYVVNGDAFGYNKLYFYTIPTKQARYICTLGNYLPQVNHKGWITFSDVNNNVFLVKNNGDSIIPLVTNKHAHDPKWDFTGNFIYYFQEAHDNITAQLLKIDTAGNPKNSFAWELPYTASFKKSDKLIYLDTKTTSCTLFIKDINSNTNIDQALITGPLYSKPGQINFDNLTLDNNDENFYWSNSNGIFRCNLGSLKIDTLLKNCSNLIYNRPIISFKANELTCSQQLITAINSATLYRQFKAIEMNLLTQQATEIKIYP